MSFRCYIREQKSDERAFGWCAVVGEKRRKSFDWMTVVAKQMARQGQGRPGTRTYALRKHSRPYLFRCFRSKASTVGAEGEQRGRRRKVDDLILGT